ncbi:MucB/RseB C-terminal domain-containing protein [Paraglaciecola aestuariivivens]
MLKILLNKNLNRAYWALFLCSFFSIQALSQETPQDDPVSSNYPSNTAQAWLSKMASAVQSLNYTITFVLLKPGVDAEPYVWRHAVNEDGLQMEQLNLLNGPGREVVRIGNKVSYFEPNFPPYSLQSDRINGPFSNDLFQQPTNLDQGYDFVMVGRSRISGRAAQQIRIISKDKSRFGLNVWLDQETGLLLKMNMFNNKAQLLEQIQVTGLQVTKMPDPFFAKIEPDMLPDIVSFNSSAQKNFRWDISYLPIGMKVIKRDIRRLPDSNENIEYFMLSDGLVDVSVYLQEHQNASALSNLVGTMQSDTLLTIQNGDINVTVIGKLPANTANAIAKSVQRVQ